MYYLCMTLCLLAVHLLFCHNIVFFPQCAVSNVTTVGLSAETVLAAVLVTIQEDIVKVREQ